MGGRLTFSAEDRAHNNLVHSYIIEVRPGKLNEMFEYVRRLDVYEQLLRSGGIHKNLSSPFMVPPQKIPEVNYIGALLRRDDVFTLAEDPDVVRIYSNELVQAHQFPRVPEEGWYEMYIKGIIPFPRYITTTMWTRRVIGAEKANRQGFKGAGVRVAIIDTGICEDHPQLWRAREIKLIPKVEGEGGEGHGTAVATIIGGTRVTPKGVFKKGKGPAECMGMAPRCDLLSIKVFATSEELGTALTITRGIYEAVKRTAPILNMSFGAEAGKLARWERGEPIIPPMEECPLYNSLKIVVEHGYIPVASAGNRACSFGIDFPAAFPFVLGVSSYEPRTGEVSDFASKGPTIWGNMKPDIVMPGNLIYTGTCGLMDYADDLTFNGFAVVSGTSFATPHASGLIALMWEAHNKILNKLLTINEIFHMLSQLGKPKDNISGWGVLTWDIYERWLETEYGVKISESRY